MLWTAAIVGSHHRRTLASEDLFSASIAAPSTAFPAFTVGSPTTDVTTSTAISTLESAIDAGGVIRFTEAGTYDLSAWTARRTDQPVRLENASGGAVVLDTGTDHFKQYVAAGDDQVFMVARARIEVDGLTFRGWNAPFLVGNSGTGFENEDGPTLDNLVSTNGTPATYGAGLLLKGTRFERCRRAIYAAGAVDLANVYAHGCDVVECGAGFWLATTPINDVYVYDCFFHDIQPPTANRPGGKPWRVGYGKAIYLGINTASSAPYSGFEIENCTADVMTNSGAWEDVDGTDAGGDRACPETGFLRATGTNGLAVRNCVIRRVGMDDAGTLCTLPVQTQAIYLKAAGTLVENCEFDRCYGAECIVTTKGTGTQTGVSRDTTIRDCWFHDGIAAIDMDRAGSVSTISVLGLVGGKTNAGDFVVASTLVESCDVTSTLFGTAYDNTAYPQTIDVDDVTVRDGAVGDRLFVGHDDTTDVNVNNLLLENVTGDGGTVVVYETIGTATPTVTMTAVTATDSDPLDLLSGGGTLTDNGGTATAPGYTPPETRGCRPRA